MIIKKEKKGDITIYYLDKDISDEKMTKYVNTFVKPSQINLILDDDTDVYTKEGKLLLKFRKYKMDSRVHQSKAGICWEMEFQADKIHIFQQFLFDLFD